MKANKAAVKGDVVPHANLIFLVALLPATTTAGEPFF